LSYSPALGARILPSSLSLLAMLSMLAAAWTILVQCDAATIVLTVFLRCIVALLALGASQRHNDAVFFLGHLFCGSSEGVRDPLADPSPLIIR